MSGVVGVGTDLVEVDRFRRILAERPGVIGRLFTDGEVELARRRPDPAQRYASRFAAKEAAMKSMGVGLGAVRFADLEVLRDGSGAPRLVVTGTAAERAAARGITAFHLSLSDTPSVAQAVVVACADPGPGPP